MHKLRNGLFSLTIVLTACSGQSDEQPANKDAPSTARQQNPIVTDKGATDAVSDAFLIVAGEQIGRVHISDSAVKPVRLLGRPDGGDAAMGSATLTWRGKGIPATQLDVYTHYRDSTMRDKAVKQIRTTSPAFATAQGLRVGLLLSEALRLQPGLKPFSFDGGRKGIRLYDDTANGLAVETDSHADGQRLVSVIVHEKGNGVKPVYQ